MNRFYFLLLSVVILSCNHADDVPPPNQPNHPAMKYTDLTGREVKKNQAQLLDVDGDGSNDFAFFVIHIGDPLMKQDKIRFAFGSAEHSLLFTDENNLSPILDKGAAIRTDNQLPFEWWEVAEVFLAQKIIEDDNSTHWEGPWQNADHKYISIQVKKNNAKYNGWVEFSFLKNEEKIVIHKSGISLEAGKDVKAGF